MSEEEIKGTIEMEIGLDKERLIKQIALICGHKIDPKKLDELIESSPLVKD